MEIGAGSRGGRAAAGLMGKGSMRLERLRAIIAAAAGVPSRYVRLAVASGSLDAVEALLSAAARVATPPLVDVTDHEGLTTAKHHPVSKTC